MVAEKRKPQGHLSYKQNPKKGLPTLSTILRPNETFTKSCRRRQQIIYRASAVVIEGKCPATRTKEIVEVSRKISRFFGYIKLGRRERNRKFSASFVFFLSFLGKIVLALPRL